MSSTVKKKPKEKVKKEPKKKVNEHEELLEEPDDIEEESIEQENTSTREDVKIRKALNKTLTTTVVKTTLKSFIKDPIILKPLEHIIYNTNKLLFEGYNFANYHTLRMLQLEQSFKPDQTFFSRCLTIVGNSSTTCKDENIKQSFEQYSLLRPKNYVIPDSEYISSGILQNAALQMVTNFKNFIDLQFFRLFKKYISHAYSKDYKESYNITLNILSSKYEGTDKIVIKYRNIITNLINKYNQKRRNLQSNPIVVLPILYHILQYNEQYHEQCNIEKIPIDKGVKLFSLLPNKKGFTYSHIKLCNSGLYGFLRHIEKYYSNNPVILNELYNIMNIILSNIPKEPLKNRLMDLTYRSFKGQEENIWKLLFKIDIFNKKNKGKFWNQIETDGKSVSITFRTKKSFEKIIEDSINENKTKQNIKKDEKSKDLCFLHNIQCVEPTEVSNIKQKKQYSYIDSVNNITYNYKTLVGLDPGRNSIYVATDSNGVVKVKKTKNYYEDAKYNKSNRTINRWTNKIDTRRGNSIQDIIELIPSKKTSSIENLELYNKFVLLNADTLFKFYGAFRFRNLEMTRYINSEKELRKMCRDLTSTSGKETLIGFGNWSANNSGGFLRGNQAGPVIKLKNMLKNYCKVIEIDEYNTSKVHNACKCCTLKNQYSEVKRDGSVKIEKIHSILFCSNKSCNGKTMNRDMNASLNILELLCYEITEKKRLEYFKPIL